LAIDAAKWDVRSKEGRVAGEKSARRLAKHLGRQVDGACPVNTIGTTAARVRASSRGTVGGAVRATAIGLAAERERSDDELNVGQLSWLALDPSGFSLTKASSQLGRLQGPPFAEIAYADATDMQIVPGDKYTTSVRILLDDGRSLEFEVNTYRRNAVNLELLELLRERCGG
jgi:hypothetical protein